MDLEQTIQELQDALVVVAAIQQRQASVQKVQAEELDAVRTLLVDGFKLHEQRLARFEEKMLEIEDKLNGLIGYLNGGGKPSEA